MITIVDYGMGNLRSVQNAIQALALPSRVSSDPSDIESADALILPGVGAFGDGMEQLRQRKLIEPLTTAVLERKVNILGICLGMQFFARRSEEYGNHEGLGWVDAEVRLLSPEEAGYPIPHMGWNNLGVIDRSPLFDGLEEEPTVYFVHSFHVVPGLTAPEKLISSTCHHGMTINASLQCGNIFGVQFHPEKSQRAGLQILKNFANLPSNAL